MTNFLLLTTYEVHTSAFGSLSVLLAETGTALFAYYLYIYLYYLFVVCFAYNFRITYPILIARVIFEFLGGAAPGVVFCWELVHVSYLL